MYSTSPSAGIPAALAFTGAGTALYWSLYVGVALLVLGSVLLTVTTLLPRLALDPVPWHGRQKLVVTLRGAPLRRRYH